VHRGSALVSDYGFDDNGNRTTHRIGPASPLRGQSWPCLGALPAGGDVTVSGSYDAQDRMTAYGTCTYDYTRNGELTRRVDSATSSTTEYDYDEFGNLRRVVLPDTRVITYHIDGLNRRVGKSINGVRQWGLLYANQLEPVAELDAAGNVVASFLYADRRHVPSLMLKGGQTYRIVADHLGSVRLVVNIATGAIAQRMAYDEYGNVVEDTNPGFQPFGYAGGLYDRDTGLVRFGARDYDAVAGRWTAKDPIGFSGKSLNLYAYVDSNPLNFIDPSGLTQSDVNFALDFAGSSFQDRSIPSVRSLDGKRTQISFDPLRGPGHHGQTFHPNDPANPTPGEWHTKLNDRYLGPLDRAGLEDLLETLVHEGMHIDQEEGIWTSLDPVIRGENEQRIRDDSFNLVRPHFDSYLNGRSGFTCP
jgi:RHS repeat-associated protein